MIEIAFKEVREREREEEMSKMLFTYERMKRISVIVGIEVNTCKHFCVYLASVHCLRNGYFLSYQNNLQLIESKNSLNKQKIMTRQFSNDHFYTIS